MIEKGMCRGGWTPVYANWEDGLIIATSKHLPGEIQIWIYNHSDNSEYNWNRGQHWDLDYCGSDKKYKLIGKAIKTMFP